MEGKQKGTKNIVELKDKVKALAKVVKDIAVTFKLTYSSMAAKAPRLLVVLTKKVREIVVSPKGETKGE